MQRNVTYWGDWRVLSRCWNECSWRRWSRLHIITCHWGWESWKSWYKLQRIWGLIWPTDIRQVVSVWGFRLKITIHCWTRDAVLYTPPPVQSDSDRILSSPTSVRSQSDHSLSKVRAKSEQTPSKLRSESDQSPSKVWAQDRLTSEFTKLIL